MATVCMSFLKVFHYISQFIYIYSSLLNFYPTLPINPFPSKIFSCRLFLAETSYRFGDFEQTFLAFDRVKALQPEGPAAQQVARTYGLGDSEAPGGGTDPKNDGISVMVLSYRPPTRSFTCFFTHIWM